MKPKGFIIKIEDNIFKKNTKYWSIYSGFTTHRTNAEIFATEKAAEKEAEKIGLRIYIIEKY